jgi:hypothetical protein
MRLVPNQEWEHITELFKTFHEYRSDSVTVSDPASRRSGYVTPDSIGYKAANMAYTETLEFRLFRFVLEYSHCSFVWKRIKKNPNGIGLTAMLFTRQMNISESLITLKDWNYSVVLQIFCWVKQINVLHINLQNPFSNERIFFFSSLQNY